MKCQARIYHHEDKKDTVVPHFVVAAPSLIAGALCGDMDDSFTVCDGEVKVKLTAIEEPHFGGCSPALEITYCCEKCGDTTFPELPNAYDLEGFLTHILSQLTETARDKLVVNYWEKQLRECADVTSRISE